MALRKILQEGDPVLREKSKTVEKFDKRLHQLLDDMAETLYKADGVGLAAPQIGVLRRVVIVDIGEEDSQLMELINPEMTFMEGEIDDSEGCLSVPDTRGYVVRPERVTVRAQNRLGQWKCYEGEGFLARAFCHELDHLDGVLFIDKMSRVDDRNNA